MCIAILKTPEGKLSDHMLTSCWRLNPDGAGLAYAKDGQMVVVRGLMNVTDMLKAYAEHEPKAAGSNMLVHFRIGTSGYKNADNTHPFVGKECVVAHNGVFFSQPSSEARSDTRMMVEEASKYLTKKEVLARLSKIEDYIGQYNKMIFLFNDGEFAIANEKAGKWDGGVWFSNTGFEAGRSAERIAAANAIK